MRRARSRKSVRASPSTVFVSGYCGASAIASPRCASSRLRARQRPRRVEKIRERVPMATSKIQYLRALALGAALSFAVTTSQAQTYPDRPIHLIAPFPAGGLADVLARAVADGISKTLGQPVIVENRAGAGGNVGADVVAKSAPDGYTLLMTSAGILTANQFLYAEMPFD